VASSDLLLFGYIQAKPSDSNCESREDLSNAITGIFTGVAKKCCHCLRILGQLAKVDGQAPREVLHYVKKRLETTLQD
jgi:hypothetical protein